MHTFLCIHQKSGKAPVNTTFTFGEIELGWVGVSTRLERADLGMLALALEVSVSGWLEVRTRE